MAAVYRADKIERRGDLAAHIASTDRYTHPDHAVPAELEPAFAELGEITSQMAERVAELIRSRGEGAFTELLSPTDTLSRRHLPCRASPSALSARETRRG